MNIKDYIKKSILLTKNKSLKESFWALGSKFIAMVFFWLISVVLARELGRDEYGQWTFYFSIVNILTVVSRLGLDGAMRRYVAEHEGKPEMHSVYNASLKIRWISSGIIILVLLLFSDDLFHLLGREEFLGLGLISGLIVASMGTVELSKAFFQAVRRLKYNMVINVVEFALKFGFIAAFIYFESTIRAAIDGLFYSLLISCVIGLYLTYRYLNSFEKPKITTSFYRRLVSYSVPILAITIGLLLLTELNVVLLGVLSSDAETGIYGVVNSIVTKVPHISIAIALGITPVFAKYKQGPKKEYTSILNRLIKINTAFMLPITLGFVLLGKLFITLVYGMEYSASYTVLLLSLPYMLAFSYSVYFSFILDYTGHAKRRAYNMIIAIVINVGLNVLLIPTYGAIGAAISTSLAYIPFTILNYKEVRAVLDEIPK